MRSVLLFAVLGFTLTGCTKPSHNEVPVAPESATTPPAQVQTAPPPAETAKPAEATPPPAESAAAESDPEKAGGGRMAKPGWCQKDADCPAGQVCEDCRGEKCCTPGCHTDAQCPSGQHCKEVQCFRAPCPHMCEGGGGDAPQGGPAPTGPKGELK